MEGWDLQCRQCGQLDRCNAGDLLPRLRALGMLRRETEPADELIFELAEDVLHRLPCRHCGAAALERTSAPDDDADWPEARRCQDCSAVLPLERLKLYPDARRCAACEEQAASAGPEREFCPRCGEVMKLRLRSRGAASYQMHCPACGAVA